MDKDCLICNSKILYLNKNISAECVFCNKIENTSIICENGHYVCNECHMDGLNTIIRICLNEKSSNPLKILDKLMNQEFCHMHGPEHHIIVGASLLTAYKNAGGDINLEDSLKEMINRGKTVPGGSCGYWGACGAGISSGIFISIISESTPLSVKPFKLSNHMTSKSLEKIGDYGGPRCCKRDSYLSIMEAITFVDENFSIMMDKTSVKCNYTKYNMQCIKEDCPFYAGNMV